MEGAAAGGAGRRALCHHARFRHQAAARHGAPPDRQDGTPAESPALRCHSRQGGRRLCRPAATGHALATRRQRGLPVSAGLLQHGRDRSLCRRCLRRLSGSVRRGLLYRQGHLRRRCFRGRARRSGAGFRRFSATICSKAFSPVPVSPPISRSSRNSRLATTSPPCVTTDGHAGTGSSCPGYSVMARARRATRTRSGMPAIGRWKMLDNLRRTLSAPAAILRLAGWIGIAAPSGARLDDIHPMDDRVAHPDSRSRRRDSEQGRDHCAQPSTGIG